MIIYFQILVQNELLMVSPFSSRQCASASLLPSSTPSPGWATATAPWTPSSTRSSWETSSELWGSSCPAAPRGQPEDRHRRSPSLSATQGSRASPAAPSLQWPPIPPIRPPLPLMLSTCWTLSMLPSSYRCFCLTKWTAWTEWGNKLGKWVLLGFI